MILLRLFGSAIRTVTRHRYLLTRDPDNGSAWLGKFRFGDINRCEKLYPLNFAARVERKSAMLGNIAVKAR